jgi:hypothetical protein
MSCFPLGGWYYQCDNWDCSGPLIEPDVLELSRRKVGFPAAEKGERFAASRNIAVLFIGFFADAKGRVLGERTAREASSNQALPIEEQKTRLDGALACWREFAIGDGGFVYPQN